MMSGDHTSLELTRSSFYQSIEHLAELDGLAWDQIADFWGYGPTTVRNAVKQSQQELNPIRTVMALKKLSSKGILRLHKHILDTSMWTIEPRPQDIGSKGELRDEVVDGAELLVNANKAVLSDNPEELRRCYRGLQRIQAQVKAELERLDSRLKNGGQ